MAAYLLTDAEVFAANNTPCGTSWGDQVIFTCGHVAHDYDGYAKFVGPEALVEVVTVRPLYNDFDSIYGSVHSTYSSHASYESALAAVNELQVDYHLDGGFDIGEDLYLRAQNGKRYYPSDLNVNSHYTGIHVDPWAAIPF